MKTQTLTLRGLKTPSKQNAMYKVTNTINDEVETFATIQEAKIHIMKELEFWNVYERQNPYTCDDFIIEKL